MDTTLSRQATIFDYIQILKPRETSLLTFIGLSAGIIAAKGWLPLHLFILCLITIALGSAGCNGLTNYLDRETDAKMIRTRNRALPSKRINPPQKILPLIAGLIITALALAWFLHPLCFIFGLIGTISSAIWRKTVSCIFFGIISGSSPVLIGWFAVNPVFSERILLLCLFISIWIPFHVWSIMLANRDDYLNAGLSYFPLRLEVKTVVKILLVLSILLYLVSILFYLAGEAGLLFLVIANLMGILIVYANTRLLFSLALKDAWRVYKLSTFPYLGVIFLSLCLDILVT
ncbi:protoheme IX farnesyltransferase [Dehalococcoidales bacterium]|nr:protoheme IX farnesyltransferase [Dehalococcoidales bacterium]